MRTLAALLLCAASAHADVTPDRMKDAWASDLKENAELLKAHCPKVAINVPVPDFSKFTGWETTPGSFCAGALEGIRQVCVENSDGPSPYLPALLKSVKSLVCTAGGKPGTLSKASLSLEGTTLTYRMAPGQANVQDNLAEWLRMQLSGVVVDGFTPYQKWKMSGFASDVSADRARTKELCGFDAALAPDYTTMGKEWAYCGEGDQLHSCAGYAPGAGCQAALTALGTICYESPALKAAAAKRIKTIACTYNGAKPKSGVFKDVPGGVTLVGTTLTIHIGLNVANVDEAIAIFLRKNLQK